MCLSEESSREGGILTGEFAEFSVLCLFNHGCALELPGKLINHKEKWAVASEGLVESDQVLLLKFAQVILISSQPSS